MQWAHTNAWMGLYNFSICLTSFVNGLWFCISHSQLCVVWVIKSTLDCVITTHIRLVRDEREFKLFSSENEFTRATQHCLENRFSVHSICVWRSAKNLCVLVLFSVLSLAALETKSNFLNYNLWFISAQRAQKMTHNCHLLHVPTTNCVLMWMYTPFNNSWIRRCRRRHAQNHDKYY